MGDATPGGHQKEEEDNKPSVMQHVGTVGQAQAGQALCEMNVLLKSLYLERMSRTSCLKTFHFGSNNASFFQVVVKETAGLALGSHVWAGSKHLSDYIINTFTPKDLSKRKVLELGAGCGLTSVALKKHFGADTTVVITETAGLLPHIRENLELNQLQEDASLRVQELNWGENLDQVNETFDFIIAAEVVFSEPLFQPLLDTIVAYSGFNTVLLLAHSEHHHPTDGIFFKKLSEYYQSVKLHRIPRGPSRSSSSVTTPASSSVVDLANLPAMTSSNYLQPQMLQKNIVHRREDSQAKQTSPYNNLGQTKDIVIFNMKRKRYSVVSLST